MKHNTRLGAENGVESVRAVLDPNVLISALLSPGGTPARVLRAWLGGEYDLVVSPLLLEELERALGYEKLRTRIRRPEAEEFVALLRREAVTYDEPVELPPVNSPDPGDDCLIAPAAGARAVLVSGDRHLLGLRDALPIYSPAEFLGWLDESVGN